jgi:hypothetical protein
MSHELEVMQIVHEVSDVGEGCSGCRFRFVLQFWSRELDLKSRTWRLIITTDEGSTVDMLALMLSLFRRTRQLPTLVNQHAYRDRSCSSFMSIGTVSKAVGFRYENGATIGPLTGQAEGGIGSPWRAYRIVACRR